jgi:hypothetical protein
MMSEAGEFGCPGLDDFLPVSDLWFCLDCGVSKNEDDMASWTPGLNVEETGANTGSCKQCFADMMRTVQIAGREEQN